MFSEENKISRTLFKVEMQKGLANMNKVKRCEIVLSLKVK